MSLTSWEGEGFSSLRLSVLDRVKEKAEVISSLTLLSESVIDCSSLSDSDHAGSG